MFLGEDSKEAVFKPRSPEPDIRCEETQGFVELGDSDQAARTRCREDVAEHPVGVYQVVQGQRRPCDVDRSEFRPDQGQALVQVRFDGPDPIGQAQVERLGANALQLIRQDAGGRLLAAVGKSNDVGGAGNR